MDKVGEEANASFDTSMLMSHGPVNHTFAPFSLEH